MNLFIYLQALRLFFGLYGYGPVWDVRVAGIKIVHFGVASRGFGLKEVVKRILCQK
jgi:hypothetical protein